MTSLEELIACLAGITINKPDVVTIQVTDGGSVIIFEWSINPDNLEWIVGGNGHVAATGQAQVQITVAGKTGKLYDSL